MAKTICKAKATGQVKERGKASIEWHDENGKPQYYCYGYIDATTEALLTVCNECRDNVQYAQEDLEQSGVTLVYNEKKKTLTSEEYFFYEWVIIEKRITEEQFSKLSAAEIEALQTEYDKFKKELRG